MNDDSTESVAALFIGGPWDETIHVVESPPPEIIGVSGAFRNGAFERHRYFLTLMRRGADASREMRVYFNERRYEALRGYLL